MRKIALLLALALLLAACDGYTETGTSTTSSRGRQGGEETVRIARATGTTEKSIEVDETDAVLEVDVTLSVGKGSYKIELIGKDDRVTLTLEARDGKTVTGRGQMASDSFGDAGYRVTAVDAENVSYTLKYTYR